MMRDGMRFVGVGSVLMSLGLSACLFGGCPDSLGGFKDGDRVQTTLLGLQASSSVESTACALGDLLPGDVLSSRVSLDGGGECPNDIGLTPTTVPRGKLQGDQLVLPNGCTGTWTLSLEGSDSADAGSPSYTLRRTFVVHGNAARCGIFPAQYCETTWVVRTVRL